MKSVLRFLLIFTLLSAVVFAAPSGSKKSAMEDVEIETKDGVILSGVLYFAKEPKKPLVVLLHSFAQKSVNWGTLPSDLRALGYNVFTLDLRGHGKSVYDVNLRYHSRSYFTQKEWLKVPSDVMESISYIRSNYPKIDCDKTSFIGADLGANAAVLTGAALTKKPQRLVLISPQVNFKGLYTPLVIASYQSTPMLVMVSSIDQGSMKQADLLLKFIQSPVKRINYPLGGTGMSIIVRNKNANADILNFFKNDATPKNTSN